jgi:hypothetical protein
MNIEDVVESLNDHANIFLERSVVEVGQRNIIDFTIMDQILLHFL